MYCLRSQRTPDQMCGLKQLAVLLFFTPICVPISTTVFLSDIFFKEKVKNDFVNQATNQQSEIQQIVNCRSN